MTDLHRSMATLQRLPTGITGLDQILHGGLFVGGTYLVIGPTGTGKTILANHVSFNRVAQGGRVLFLSLFTEQHAQMFAYLQAFQFFNPAVIGSQIVYLSVYAIFEAEGWDGLLTYLRQEVRQQQATLVVLDGFTGFLGAAYGPMTALRFLHDLQTFIYAMQATLIFTMLADGIFTLGEPSTADAVHAELIVKKFRGSPFARGAHRLAILPAGITVLPRSAEHGAGWPMSVILVLEDERPIADLLVDILEEEGYQVVLGANGREGLTLLAQHPITLIITDLMMPEMTGIEFCAHLVAHGPHPPIVVVSATAVIHARLCPGAAAIIGKPFQTEDLLDTVQQLIA